jgi:hypothetical protein
LRQHFLAVTGAKRASQSVEGLVPRSQFLHIFLVFLFEGIPPAEPLPAFLTDDVIEIGLRDRIDDQGRLGRPHTPQPDLQDLRVGWRRHRDR